MYNLTQEDFLQIQAEAMDPDPGENAYATTFAVMERIFPGYLYARRSSFPCEEDLEDCLTTAEIRIVERLRRYYFEREDMQKSPESLQRWMFTVLKNCHYTVLRQSEAGREMLRRVERQASSELGLTYTAEGRLHTDTTDGTATCDGGFDALFRKEALAGQRDLITACFREILTGRSDVQIILAWLTVGTMMLTMEIKKKDAIAKIADADPTMEELFRLLRTLLSRLPWIRLTPEDWEKLLEGLDRTGKDGHPIRELRFGDFTAQSTREYISKSINKRNDALSLRHGEEAEYQF